MIGPCRHVAGQRRDSPKRKKRQNSESTMSPAATLLLGLATIASVTSPVAAGSLHTPSPRTPQNRRQRRAAGERNVRRRISSRNGGDENVETENSNYNSRINIINARKKYIEPPKSDSPETTAAQTYDQSSHVPGSLIHPEYEIGDAVWAYELGDWIKAVVTDNTSFFTELGAFAVKILDEKESSTLLLGGAHLLARDEGDETINFKSEDTTFIDDMPGNDDTTEAEIFLNAGANPIPKSAPDYLRGDTVWFYRRRRQMWVTATVVDTR